METLTKLWETMSQAIQPLIDLYQNYEPYINLFTNVANAFFLVGFIVLAILRMTDGRPKARKEQVFLLCISMGAIMQLYPFPNPEGVPWDLVLFRMGAYGWGAYTLLRYRHPSPVELPSQAG